MQTQKFCSRKMCEPQHYDFDINLDFLDFTSLPTKGSQSATPVAVTGSKSCLNEIAPVHVGRKNTKIEELAKRIASADLSVHQIQSLEKERSALQQQLRELQSSANDIQQLYVQENQERKRLKQLTDELSKKCESLQSEITNKNFSCDQLESHIETFKRLPVEYNDLVQSYLRLCHQQEEDTKTLHWHQTSLIDKLRKYCKEHSLQLPEQNKRSPKKRTAKITKTEAGIQCELWLAVPIPVPQPPTVKKEMRSQGTQHISTVTTRSTSTTTLITKHNVGTCFPEPRPFPPINDMVNEMLKWEIQPLSPISDPLPEIPIDIVPTTKSTGTCTMLCNIQRSIDYIGSHSVLTSIKHSNSRPPSRNMFENVKHELPSPPANFGHLGPLNSSLSAGTFENMWQVFGHVLFSLLGNRADIRNASERSGDALSHQEFHHWFRTMYEELSEQQEQQYRLSSTETSVPVNLHAPTSEDQRPLQYNVATSPLRFDSTSATNDLLDNKLHINTAASPMQCSSPIPKEYKIHVKSQAQTEIPNSDFQVPLEGREFRKINEDNIVNEILKLFPSAECTKEHEKKIKKLLKEKFKRLNKKRKIAKQEVQMEEIHTENVDSPDVLQSKNPQNSIVEETVIKSVGEISEQQCDSEDQVEEEQIKNGGVITAIENHTQIYAKLENSEETITKYDTSKNENETLVLNSHDNEELEPYEKEQNFEVLNETKLAWNCNENAVDFLTQLGVSNNIPNTEMLTTKSYEATYLNMIPNETILDNKADCHVFRKPIAYAAQRTNNGQSAETTGLVFSLFGSDSDDSESDEVDQNVYEMKQEENEAFGAGGYNCHQNETEIPETKDDPSLSIEDIQSIEKLSYTEDHKSMYQPHRRKLFQHPEDSFEPEFNKEPSLYKRNRTDITQSNTLDIVSEVQLFETPFEESGKTHFTDVNADLKKPKSKRDPSERFPNQFCQKSEIKTVPSQSNLFQEDRRRNELPEFKIFQKPVNVNELRQFRVRQKHNLANEAHKLPLIKRSMDDVSDALMPLKANETNQQLINEKQQAASKSLESVTSENESQKRLKYSSNYQSEHNYFMSPKKHDSILPMEIRLPCIIQDYDVVEQPDSSLVIDEHDGNASDEIIDDGNSIEISSTIKEEAAEQTDISWKTESRFELKADELKWGKEISSFRVEAELNMTESNNGSISKSSVNLNTTVSNRSSTSCSLFVRDELNPIGNNIVSISRNDNDSKMAESKCSISPLTDTNLLSDVLTTPTSEVIKDFLEDDKQIVGEDNEYKFKNYLNHMLRSVAPRNVPPISSIETISTISTNEKEQSPTHLTETNANPSEPKRRGRKRKINTYQNIPPTASIACKRSERLRVKKLVVEATSESIRTPPKHDLVQLGKYTTKLVNKTCLTDIQMDKINKAKEKKIPTSPKKMYDSDDEPLSIIVNNVSYFNERSSDFICKHLTSDKEETALEKQTIKVIPNKSLSPPKTYLPIKRTPLEIGPRNTEVPKAFQNNFQNSAEWTCKTLEKKKCVVFPQQVSLEAKNIVSRTETSVKSNTNINCDIHGDTTLSDLSAQQQYDLTGSQPTATKSPSTGFYADSEEIPLEPYTTHFSANRLKTFSQLPSEKNNASTTSPPSPKEKKYKIFFQLSEEQNDSPSSPMLSTENEDKTYLLLPENHIDSPASPPQSISSPYVDANTKEIPLDLNTTHILAFNSSLIQRLISNYSLKLYETILRNANKPTTETETQLSQSLQTFLDMQTDDESATMLLAEELFAIAQHDVSSQISAAIILVMQNVPRPEIELDCDLDKVPPKYLGKQHRRISLVMRRIQKIHSNFNSELMTKIESKLFNYHSTEKISLHAALNLTQLYLLTVSMQLPDMKICPTRLFVIKCLYYYKQMAVPMINEVLSCFPTTLPHREERRYDRADALITVIQHHLMSTKYDMDKQELRTKDLLSKLRFEYHFEPFKPDRTEVIANLMAKLKGDKLEHVSYALALLCKRTVQPKVEEEILKGLLVPLANEYYQNVAHSESYDTRIACLIESISMIIKPFAIETNISAYLSIFSRFLNATSRPMLQEAAVQAIIRCQRFGFVNCYYELLNFNPSYELQTKTKAMFMTFVHQKPKNFWISFNRHAGTKMNYIENKLNKSA